MKARIANNKNIQTMEQKDIDIYEILKDEEYGTELYTPKCGRVWHSGMANNKDSAKAIWTEDEAGREHFFDKNGKIDKKGEPLLFPSKEMRDWNKFFKKGDVLVSKDREVHIIFEKFEDDDFTKFRGKHYLWKECYNEEVFQMETSVFEKASDDDAQTYINNINKCFGGKLNRETLEIEKPAKLTFEVGKLYVFNEEDEDGELTIIGELIAKNESEDTLTFGNQYEIENEKFVTDQTFDLRISVHEELREATENEVELFNKHYDIWKNGKEQPAFKTFDKVLVRCGKGFKWLPAFFVRDRGEDFASRYNVLPLHSGKTADFTSCIQYEGHENIAFTSYDIENLPF
nr:MAG: hypothetical protein [Bacteriophage sp.]